MKLGTLSAGALGASGLAIALMPRRTAAALQIEPLSARGVTETRVGLGGTYAGLAVAALLRRSPDAYAAVGATWLGAAAVRAYSLRVDEPDTDPSFYAYLSAETLLGAAGLLASLRRGR